MSGHTFEILQHETVGARYRRLRARAPQVARTAKPGQYMHVLPNIGSSDPLLRRAFSILRCHDDWFEMLYRIEGRGTQILAQSRVGDFLDALGPLGQPFTPATRNVILVGGGIGVPPLVFLAERQRAEENNKSAVSRETLWEVFIGVRSREDMVEEAALRACTDKLTIAAQDGSIGERGLVTQPFEKRLQEIEEASENADFSVCACGPWPMLRAVAELCAKYRVACQVSMEENMPCGIGVCNGCVVPILNPSDEYERFQRVCVVGPVMDAAQIDWGTKSVTAGLEDGRAARESN